MIKLHSEIDSSVNFIYPGEGEFRYVTRHTNSFIAYLSSHYGCNKSCRFCFLTKNGQVSNKEIEPFTIYMRAKEIVDYAKNKNHSDVSFSFMSMGDALTHSMWYNGTDIVGILNKLAYQYKLNPKIKVSTIIPNDTPDDWCFEKSLFDIDLYYSIYSIDSKFRKKWMPKARNIDDAIAELKVYQYNSGKQIIMHGAWIEGENNNLDKISRMLDKIGSLNHRWNIVRYNAFDDKYREAENLADIMKLISQRDIDVSLVSRVGKDVSASCGMFVNV